MWNRSVNRDQLRDCTNRVRGWITTPFALCFSHPRSLPSPEVW